MARFPSFVLLFVIGCGGGKTADAPTKKTDAQPVAGVERFFPLEEGRIYHYVTKNGADSGMLVAKVHRTDAAHGELRLSNGTQRYIISPDGVSRDNGVFVLKAPIEVGTSWAGEHGGKTKITSIDAAATVPAGSYSSCVKTVEEGGRPPGAKYETTYCPGIGMVLLEITAEGQEVRAELKSYGFPQKVEEGTSVTITK